MSWRCPGDVWAILQHHRWVLKVPCSCIYFMEITCTDNADVLASTLGQLRDRQVSAIIGNGCNVLFLIFGELICISPVAKWLPGWLETPRRLITTSEQPWRDMMRSCEDSHSPIGPEVDGLTQQLKQQRNNELCHLQTITSPLHNSFIFNITRSVWQLLQGAYCKQINNVVCLVIHQDTSAIILWCAESLFFDVLL